MLLLRFLMLLMANWGLNATFNTSSLDACWYLVTIKRREDVTVMQLLFLLSTKNMHVPAFCISYCHYRVMVSG